jgi:hypothetical protein
LQATRPKPCGKDLWLTRIEVGSEIDDLIHGTDSMKHAKVENNEQKRSQVIGAP